MIYEIITSVMRREGWDKYTNHPADRGGPTKWGITLKAWQEYRGDWTSVTAEDVKAITEPQARDFYEKLYVYGPRFNQLPEKIVELVVDCAVHHGQRRAAKWVQRAVGSRQDGAVGRKTIAAAYAENSDAIILRIIAYRTKLFGRLVTNDPSQAAFAAGWNNRAMKFALILADQLSTR